MNHAKFKNDQGGYIHRDGGAENESDDELRFKRVSIADVLTNPPEPQKYVWGGRIPVGELTLLSAHGGTGKSTFALQLAAHTATDTPFLGLPTGDSQ